MSFKNEYRIVKTNRRKINPTLIVGAVIVLLVCFAVMAVLGAFSGKGEDVSSLAPVSSAVNAITLASSEESSSEASTSSVTTSAPSTTSSKVQTSSVASVKPSTSSKASSVTTSSAPQIEANVPNGDWRLVIANKQYPLPESYKINVTYLPNGYRLDSRIVDAYNSMIAGAKEDGITLKIISGFRTYQGQTTLFNNKVNKYLNQGYSREKAKELAAQYVAPPGTSEHLTGLAVDLISTNWYNYNSDLNSGFEKTKEFEWLYNNCAEYGFVLRYPKDKEVITGYSYEPWHYRYVGIEAAKEIMSNKICLEEYVERFN
ncbi:MAG: M15 family metallopeptidase [Oscillospiraceae bacterium]|nr:M15 family metallopeptidase [Oscillospiraceae bacterium]